MGFAQVSVSHEVSPLIKLVGRGDTTVVDAYLSPILRRYVAQVAEELSARPSRGPSPCGGGTGGGSGGERQRDARSRKTPPPDPPPADLRPASGRREPTSA